MDIQLFNNPQFGDVRMSADENGEPLFCAVDVAKALGYSNPYDAVARHCNSRGLVIREVPTKNQFGAVVLQNVKFISEGNFYRLISRSNLPESEKFESWIFDDVVPQIRKTGRYDIRNLGRKELALMVIQQEEEKEALMLENKRKEELLEEQKPKVVFADAVVGSKSSCLIGELAKILSQNGYEIGQNRLFAWLRAKHYLGTTGEYYNIPCQKYIEMGLFELKKNTHSQNGQMVTTVTPKVTGKGQQYFINKFLGGK